MCSVRHEFFHHDFSTLNFRFLLMHINLLNSDRFYSRNICFDLTFYIIVACCTTGVLISQKFTTGCIFFCISRRGEKVSLNILRRVFLILRGKSQYSKVTKQWVWKPIKVEKERGYLQPTVRDVIAMRKTSAMFRYLIYLAYRATSYQSNHQVFLL